MHRLQELFATAEGEQAFHDGLHAQFGVGDLAGAEALLAAELATLEGEIAGMCRGLSSRQVALSGWDELADAIAMHEGEPVTGVTLAIANALDLAFEKGETHDPYITAGLYTDEGYAFSTASSQDLLAQCRAEERAAWAGLEEDVELYLEIEGLGALNTALLFHKQRHFFRDDAPEAAPLRYVDYVLGCWWRALRFQQAVAAECARHPLPGGIRIVAGMIEMRPELVVVHEADAAEAAPAVARPEAAEMGEMAAATLIQRRQVEPEREPTGADLRRRLIPAEARPEPETGRKGLLGRLFGRTRVFDEAA